MVCDGENTYSGEYDCDTTIGKLKPWPNCTDAFRLGDNSSDGVVLIRRSGADLIATMLPSMSVWKVASKTVTCRDVSASNDALILTEKMPGEKGVACHT